MAPLKKICPICVLVACTWVTMFVLRQFGYNVDEGLLAMLMGGSAVGVSYALGTRLKTSSRSVSMVWKFIAIPLGFSAMYALLRFSWGYAVAATIVFVLAWVLFHGVSARKKDERRVDDISKALDACC